MLLRNRHGLREPGLLCSSLRVEPWKKCTRILLRESFVLIQSTKAAWINLPRIFRTLGSVANLALVTFTFDWLRLVPKRPVVRINNGVGVWIAIQALFHPIVYYPAIKVNFRQHVGISPLIKGVRAWPKSIIGLQAIFLVVVDGRSINVALYISIFDETVQDDKCETLLRTARRNLEESKHLCDATYERLMYWMVKATWSASLPQLHTPAGWG